jgi:exonuclease III
MSWNVRGMNSGAIQEDIKQVTNIFKPDLICIQETKMEVINNTIIRSTLGYDYEGQFGYLPASGASGGILITVRDSVLHILNPTITSHTISVAIHDCRINKTWWFTEVYGPQGELEKKMFIHELRLLEQAAPLEWLIMGDFNLTYNLEDRNNDRLDRRMMTRFRRALNFLELKEI